jgi:hypothetical protein
MLTPSEAAAMTVHAAQIASVVLRTENDDISMSTSRVLSKRKRVAA